MNTTIFKRPGLLRIAAITVGISLVNGLALAGTIQGITVTPQPALTGDPISVTVTGTGTCANGVVVDYGDGDSKQESGDLPLSFPNKSYSQSGTYIVSAVKAPNTLGCKASASTSVKIIKPGEVVLQLCAAVDCEEILSDAVNPAIKSLPVIDKALPPSELGAAVDPAIKFLPVIETVFTTPKLWTLTPDGELHLNGKGFGDQAGSVYLRLQPPYQSDLAMSVQNWSDTQVKVKVPANITGVADHNAAVFVETKEGNQSNWQTINFEAERDSKWLNMDDPVVQVIFCSHGANHNFCNNHKHSDGSCFGPGQANKDTAAFTVFHQNCDSIIDRDEGTDTLVVGELKKGWEIVEVTPFFLLSSISEYLNMPDKQTLTAEAAGKTSWVRHQYWEVSPGMDYIQYGFMIKIRGPKGVSHY